MKLRQKQRAAKDPTAKQEDLMSKALMDLLQALETRIDQAAVKAALTALAMHEKKNQLVSLNLNQHATLIERKAFCAKYELPLTTFKNWQKRHLIMGEHYHRQGRVTLIDVARFNEWFTDTKLPRSTQEPVPQSETKKGLEQRRG